MRFLPPATIAQRDEFDEVIDVRTPAEFADDHIPGAINCPVLSDDERVVVGTLYKQASPFEARKVGAALVARNIAHHLDARFHDRPKSWRPLVCCWRGGQRSGAMTLILQQVGWGARQLEGGYKQYRKQVMDALAEAPARYRFRVLCGPTGSGKSRLLDALAEAGHQVLDLERLACHRGSVLGALPDEPQPSQKRFESLLWLALSALDPARPVHIEAESRRIGRLTVPGSLIDAMHQGDCLCLEVPLGERVRFLLEDYDYFLRQPAPLMARLSQLRELHGREKLAQWEALIKAGAFPALVEALLVEHYDPLYGRSTDRHYANLAEAQHLRLDNLSVPALTALAAEWQDDRQKISAPPPPS